MIDLSEIKFDRLDAQDASGLVSDLSRHARADDTEFMGLLTDALRMVQPRLLETKYPQNLAESGQIVPFEPAITYFAETITYVKGDRSGKFYPYRGGLDLAQAINVHHSTLNYPIEYRAGYIEYGLLELQQSQNNRYTGSSLVPTLPSIDQRKLDAMRKVQSTEQDDMILLGSGIPGIGIPGFLNNPDIDTILAPYAIGPAATPDQIITMITAFLNFVPENTLEVEEVDTWILTRAPFNYLNSTVRASGSDQSIMDFIRKACPNIRNVITLPKASGLAANGRDIMLTYRRDPGVLTHQPVMPLMLLPPQADGPRFKVWGLFGSTGTNVLFPKACRRMELI